MALPPRSNLNPSHLPSLSHSSNPRKGQAIHHSVSQPQHYSHLNDYSPTSATPSSAPAPSHPTPSTDSDSDSTASDPSSDSDDPAAVDAVLNPPSTQPSWRGAFQRRVQARAAAQAAARSARKAEERKQAKIPVPALPDLRFEQGVLLSIRPFVHRVGPKREAKGKGVKAAKREEAEEDGAMVGGPLTKEGAEDGDTQEDVFSGPVRIEWGQLSYVIFRDQVSLTGRVVSLLVGSCSAR